jgi:hypothetical protein
MQTFFYCSLADHVERFSKFFKLGFMESFREYIGNLLICLGGHHFNLSLKNLIFYVVAVIVILCSGSELLYAWSSHRRQDFLLVLDV